MFRPEVCRAKSQLNCCWLPVHLLNLIAVLKKVIVIGSGFSGLSAAACLAREGFHVTILEKNETPGGRARQFEAEGFVFDMGPSWYWMPDVFEQFFALFGKKVSDYYNLVRLDPSYQVIFKNPEQKGGLKDVVEIPAKMSELEQFFESIESGSAAKLRQFLSEAEYKYRVGYLEFYLTFVENLAETLETICAKNVSKVTFVPCLQNNRKNGCSSTNRSDC